MENALTPVVPMPHGNGLMTQQDGGLLAQWRQQQAEYMTSLVGDSERVKQLRLKVLLPGGRTAKEAINEPLRVVDWYLHPVSLTNRETGEVTDALRLVFVTDDDSTVSTTSEVLVKAWAVVCQTRGNGPFKPPLELVLGMQKSGGVHSYLVIRSCKQAEDTAPKATSKR